MSRLTVILLLAATVSPLRAEDAPGILQTFNDHCVKCHGLDGKVKGKVNLLEIESAGVLGGHPKLLGDIIDVIEFEEMPPEDEPGLPTEHRAKFLQDLKHLRQDTLKKKTLFTRTPIRRMNRFQYDNAVVDLFELRGVVFSLPERMMREHNNYFQPGTGSMADTVTVGSRPLGKSQMIERRLAGVAAFPQDLRAEHGFDNRGDHLSLSPLLMESFLKLGQSVVESDDFNELNVGIWKAFFEQPQGVADLADEIHVRLERLLARAFRRPVGEDVLNRYHGYTMEQIGNGMGFTDAMKAVAAVVISSPRFLYLYDGAGSGEDREPIDDFELASRLSFFLWGSIPDQELLEVAGTGELRSPDVLEQQFERMLKDRKVKRFCDSFPTQWLQLERIISSAPNRERFPDFYYLKYRDSMHMMLEPLLVFETVLIENQPIIQLIDSDFTYRSPLLEEAYQELATPGAKKGGSEVVILTFHRVPVTDRRNGGVITTAATMTMTSGPERTQPITRGAWIAGVIFNNPPEPPPANVPPLAEKPAEGEEHLTLRERLAQHREREDCRGCHEQIDPLGFALENYDPIGNWRDRYENGRDVDVAGTLFRKHKFDNVIEFKDAILAEKDRFARGFAAHLLSFALARELGPADQVALDQIVEGVVEDQYRMQALLKHIVTSEPFLNKTSPPSPEKVAKR
jgi:hypothetical protein